LGAENLPHTLLLEKTISGAALFVLFFVLRQTAAPSTAFYNYYFISKDIKISAKILNK